MQLRNTPETYGAIAKILHWSIAVLFLTSYCAVYYRHWFTTEAEEYTEWVGSANYTVLQSIWPAA